MKAHNNNRFILLVSVSLLIAIFIASSGRSISSLRNDEHNLQPWNTTRSFRDGIPSLQSKSRNGTAVQGLQHDSTSKEKSPYFILHIGPAKTATTTLQSILSKVRTKLSDDHYKYVGPGSTNWGEIIRGLTFKCQRKLSKLPAGSVPQCWEPFHRLLRESRDNGINVFLSAETFSYRWFNLDKGQSISQPFYWPALEGSLEGWDVHVVLSYRRYFEWLVSAIKQRDYDRSMNKNSWPERSKPHFEPLWIQVLQHLNGTANQDDFLFYYLDEVLPRYHGHFPIHLLNMHNMTRPSLLETMFCDIVPNVPHMCTWSDGSIEKKTVQNAGAHRNFEFDRIAVYAGEIGLLSANTMSMYDRRSIAKKIKEFVDENKVELEMICPLEADLQLFLDRSLAFERDLMPNFEGEKTHCDNFWKWAAHFCYIDIKRLFQKEEFRLFFSELAESSVSN